LFNNETDRLKGVADTVLEVIKKSQDKTVDEAITRSVKDGVTTISYTGADAKNRPTPSTGMDRAKSLAQMGMKKAEADKKKKLNEYTPGSGGVTRVTGKSYGASTKEKDNLDIDGPSSKDLKKIDRNKKLDVKPKSYDVKPKSNVAKINKMRGVMVDSKKPFTEMCEDYAQNGLPSLQKKYNDLSVTPGQVAEPAFYADKQTDGVDHQTDNTRSATQVNQDRYEAEMKKNQKFMSQRKDGEEEAASGTVPSNIRVTVRNESAPMSTVTNDDIHQELDEMYPRSFNGGVRVLKNSKELTPAQQKIDVHDDDKIDGKDFKKLRAMKKEGASADDDYKANMKHHVMKDTVAMKKKGMSGLEPVTEKDAYFDNVVLDEKKMTPDEDEHKEYIVKGMKKNLKSFKDTYGKDAKNVMYATATKLAQKDDYKDKKELDKDMARQKDESYGMIKASKKQKNEAEAVDGYDKCWDGYRKDGTKPGTGKNTGKRVNNCVKEDATHYTKDGKEWKGPKHKMKDGTMHTGATHTDASKELVDESYGKVNASYGMMNASEKKRKTDKYGTPILTPAQKKESDARRARAKAQYMSDNQR
jgi:hypothetical protein|tara:strand:+ start:281 stop:2035 length:1755 start_codon:yes stop_codon:yes gene_type:complete